MEKGRRRLLAGMLLLSPLVVNAWNDVTISGCFNSESKKYKSHTLNANEAAFSLKSRYTMGIGVPFHEVSPTVLPNFAELNGNKIESIGTALIPEVPCFYTVNSTLSKNYAEGLKVFDLVCPIMASIDVSDPEETVTINRQEKKVIRRINIYRSVENQELYFSPIGAFLGEDYKASWENKAKGSVYDGAPAYHEYTLSCFYDFPKHEIPAANEGIEDGSDSKWWHPGGITRVSNGKATLCTRAKNGDFNYSLIKDDNGVDILSVAEKKPWSAIALQKTQEKNQGFEEGAISIPWTATQCYNEKTVLKPYSPVAGAHADYGLFGMKLTAMNQVLVTRVVAGNCVEITYHYFFDGDAVNVINKALFKKDCDTRRFAAYLQRKYNTPEDQDRLGIYWKLNNIKLNGEADGLRENLKALLENDFDEKLDENQRDVFYASKDPVEVDDEDDESTTDDEGESVDLDTESGSLSRSGSSSRRNSYDSDYYSDELPVKKPESKGKVTSKKEYSEDADDESSHKERPVNKTQNQIRKSLKQTNQNKNNDDDDDDDFNDGFDTKSRFKEPRYTKKLTEDDLKDLEAREKLLKKVAEMREKEHSARASRQASQQSSVQTSPQESDLEDTISTSVKRSQAPSEVKKPARRGGLLPAAPKRRMVNRWTDQ